MRLIDADALIERIEKDIKAIEDKEPQMAMGAIGVLNTIKKAPTALAVVRCKDCKNRHELKHCAGRRPDWFCADGIKQVTGKLNNPDDSLLPEDSGAVKEQKSKLDSEQMREYIPKDEVLDIIKSMPRDLVEEYVYELDGIWLDDDEEKLQLSGEPSTNGTYIRNGRLMHDLVYRGEAEVSDTDLISRQAAIKTFIKWGKKEFGYSDINREERFIDAINALPLGEDMGEVSDGYHTFNQLYHQRAVLFATIVNQNKDKAWKSWKHEDGQFCFDKGGEWFIVGVDTPEGSYTYHYEKKYWDMFDCEELDRGKHWDGHTEDDVTRLLSLPPVEPKPVCEDAISRKWVLNEIITKVEDDDSLTDEQRGSLSVAKYIIRHAPPAEPERPKRTETMMVNGEPTEIDPLSYEVGYSHGQSERPKGEWVPCTEPPKDRRNVFLAHGTNDFKSCCIGHYEQNMGWYEDRNFFAKPIYDCKYWCDIPDLPDMGDNQFDMRGDK